MTNADVGLAPAKELAECPPKNKAGEEPKVSRALCKAMPHKERKMALRWVMVSGPVMRERGSSFFLEMLTVVWKGGAIARISARNGSEVRL